MQRELKLLPPNVVASRHPASILSLVPVGALVNVRCGPGNGHIVIHVARIDDLHIFWVTARNFRPVVDVI